MGILNENLDLAKIPQDVRNAFAGEPERVHLREGERLFRFLSLGRNNPVSFWWIPHATYALLLERSQRLGVPISKLARSKLAVSSYMNPEMDHLAMAMLVKDVIGLRGLTKYQPAVSSADHTVLVPGGLVQLWIPNLAMEETGGITRTSAEISLGYFVAL